MKVDEKIHSAQTIHRTNNSNLYSNSTVTLVVSNMVANLRVFKRRKLKLPLRLQNY